MKSILKATAVLSSVSAMSILTGLVSAKVNAVLLGPGGLGLMGLLQSVLNLSVMIAGMGVGTGIVRAGARALAQGDERQVAALRGGAWLLLGALGGMLALLLIILRVPLSRWMLGGAEHSGAVVLISLAALFAIATTVHTGMLNAQHRIGDLARIGVLNSLVGVSLTLLFVWVWRERGIAPSLLFASAFGFAVTYYYVRRRAVVPRIPLTRREVFDAARSLLGFGAPYTASMIVGTGVQLLLPVVVLHLLSRDSVGFYRAATTISINYLGFLLVAMAQDYYPRISAASDQPDALTKLVNDQLRLVLLLGGPVILAMLALVPHLVPLIYSAQFTPASELLEWQLIGDLFKFTSWTMAFVILARSGSATFFLVELAGGALMLGSSWLGMRWFGLTGLGLGFLLTCVIYCGICFIILRRTLGLRWTTENTLFFLAFLAAMILIRALPALGLEPFRTPVALVAACALGAVSLSVIWGEVGGLRGLLARRKTA